MGPLRRLAVSAALLAILALSALPGPAWAGCAACAAGDPSVSAVGIPDADRLGLVAGVASQITRNTGGDQATGTYDQLSQQVSLLGIWSASRSVRVQLMVPYVQRNLTDGGQHWLETGFGDPTASATVMIWKSPGLSFGQALALTGGAVIPAGQRVPGANEHAQPGQGAWSVIAGADWFAHYHLWSLYLSQLVKYNAPNVEGYQWGNSWMGNLGVQRPVLLDALSGTLELNARYYDFDHDHDGFTIVNQGGTVVYLTPGFLADLGTVATNHLFVRGSVQVPVLNQEFGIQNPGLVWQLGINAAF